MRQSHLNVSLQAAARAWRDAEQPDAAHVVTVSCELITPMYGGGVKVGIVDKSMPIRATALRGQLRFWWRLLQGTDPAVPSLFASESRLWGGIAGPEPRASRVTVQVSGSPVSDDDLIQKGPGGIPAYALISEPGRDPLCLRAGYRFTVLVKFDPTVGSRQRDGVIEALRWWATFGGVGARTRRGLGAVRASSEDIALPPVLPGEVEAVGGWLETRATCGQDAARAWSGAISALRKFRQGLGLGRRQGSRGRPGRSQWPEARAIRLLARRHAQPPVSSSWPSPHEAVFPRAAFGLPIIFHFKDRSDPADHVLKPSNHERMASPLILRPYFDGKRYAPAALLLPGWQERISGAIEVKRRDSLQASRSRPAWPPDPARRREFAEHVVPLRQCQSADALSAFMQHFASSGGDK